MARVSWAFVFVVLGLVLARVVVSSQHIVESLPGYPGKLPFKLETGYISVGEHDEIQLFYYFIESMRNPLKDPLMLWLTGGPGCSALSGLIYEIGPMTFDFSTYNGSLPIFTPNENSWTEVASIIFLDAPVGTGFSYSTTSDGYKTSDTKSSEAIYQFMRKWFLAHPRYDNNPMYIGGDSYAGLIVPQVTQKLSDAISAGLGPIANLQGYIIGNGLTDIVADENARMEYYNRVALISDELYESVKANCGGEYVYPDSNNSACIDDLSTVTNCLERLNVPHILEPKCNYATPEPEPVSPLKSLLEDPPVEILQLAPHARPELWCRVQNYILSYIWANDAEVQEALHIRNGTIPDWKRCNKTLSYEYNVDNVVQLHYNLSRKGYRALIYSGDHDRMLPYVSTQRWIVSLNMTVSDTWRPWFVNGQVAGYTVKYKEFAYAGGDGLTFATVKGGGHTAPEYKPVECIEMIDRWLSYYAL